MPTLRTHSISTKVTEAEYDAIWKRADPQTVSAWARDVLLGAAQPVSLPFVVLAELLALRTIVLNLHYALITDGPPATDAMRGLIDRADAARLRRAHERLEELRHAAERHQGDEPDDVP